jgi:hypothetical protein
MLRDRSADLSPGQDRAAPAASPFVLSTGDFWLNLHQYLYVLGRAEAKMPDAGRAAVADAPVDQAEGIAALSAAERETWAAAVRHYAAGPSRQDPIFDAPLIETGNLLVRAGDDPSLAGLSLDAGLAAVLERVAPLYRKAWWPAHRAANERWTQALEPLARAHGARLVAAVTRAYRLSWPTDGYPVRVVAFANWAGAFSTRGPLLLVSSRAPGQASMSGLESVLHESMHQWDDAMWRRFRDEAKRQNKVIAADITHALIFFTAGEVVRGIAPGYVPYADANGIWTRGLAPFRGALEAAWKPWLEGRGTLEGAIAEVVRLLPPGVRRPQ